MDDHERPFWNGDFHRGGAEARRRGVFFSTDGTRGKHGGGNFKDEAIIRGIRVKGIKGLCMLK
jgi:hypothetical protein